MLMPVIRPVVFALLLMPWVSGSAGAAAPIPTLKYELYAGGLHALAAQIDVKEGEGRYDVVVSSATASGFKLVAPWSGVFSTTGWLTGNGRLPETFKSASKSSDKTKVKTTTYSREATLVSYKSLENDKDKTPDPLNPELAPPGIVDVLTATLGAIDRLNAGKECTGISTIFDGDRSFSLSFKDAGEQQIEAGKYNLYYGPAVACSFAMEPLKGKWRKKLRGWLMLQAQARKLGTEPMVYFARLEPAGSYVPVRVQVKTDYGVLILHLTQAHPAPSVVPVSVQPVKNAN